MKTLCRGLLLLSAFLLSGAAWADRPGHHGHVELGVYVGAPWAYPPYYPYPVYWPRVYGPPVVIPATPVVVAPPAPPVYVEQPAAAVPTLEPGYWYYCNESQAYFPYVKSCAGSWQKVAPQPAR
jgi:hypothetical protein